MNRGSPSIACIGVIGRHDNPLHITVFPPSSTTRDPLSFQFLLNTSLDIFEARLPSKPASHDFGLLQAVDERLAMYGWLTNTGVKFVVVVDMEGRPAGTLGEKEKDRSNVLLGIRDADLRPAFKAIHAAYIRVLRNPFYDPDDHDVLAAKARNRAGSTQIMSPMFVEEIQRIGEAWYPGIPSL